MILVGYCEMKKCVGKVLFVTEEGGNHIVGVSTDKLYFYGDSSKKINSAHIGKEITCSWDKGYGNKAQLVDIHIK